MSQLIVENVTKTVGEKTLFQQIHFTIKQGEKVGLIGVNGTGKSTLLAMLAGVEEADSMRMDHPNQYRIAYLPQQPHFDPEKTVIETVFESDAPIVQVNLDYEHAVQALAQHSDSPYYQERFVEAQNAMDAQDAWDLNAKAHTILSKLGITSFNAKMGTLSGGQQKRVALAKVLIEPADLLLLDEPTNHLDVPAITWLQEQLKNETGAILFVTHDRYFLDTVATTIYEIADQTLYTHSGNYGDYLEAKAIREEMAEATAQKLQNRYRSELKWIRRGAKARSTKQKARIDRFEELTEKVKKGPSEVEMDVSMQSSRLGRKIIELQNVSKQFGDKWVIRNFSTLLQAGDRIAIVGPNGAGKTTLMNIIAGQLQLDEGERIVGSTVKIAYFHQHLPPIDGNKRMIEIVRDISNDIVDAEGVRISASQMLERFLFPPSMHGTPVHKLSGGEQKRLQLLLLLMEQPNVLLLDEPTNDLDLETLSVLEAFIDTFPGVVLTISHDRFFLDRTCSKIWMLDGHGSVRIEYGTYTDFIDIIFNTEETIETKEKATPVTKEKNSTRKMTYSEKREWETIESRIEEVENQITEAEAEMDKVTTDYDKLQSLAQSLEELNHEYEQLIERWSELEEIAQA